MKLYVDDMRPVPEGWRLAETNSEAIAYLKTGQVTHISLDYDRDYDGWNVSGYFGDIMLWLIDEAHQENFDIPIHYKFHTSSGSGRRMYKMWFWELQKLVPFELQMIL